MSAGGGEGDSQAAAPAGRFTAVSVGFGASCAVRESGELACWGWGSANFNLPAGRFTAVSTGGNHACGLRESGAIECWGDNITVHDAPDP